MPTKKKVTKLANLIIIDASGSMSSKVEDVKGGLKQLLTQIEEDAKKDKKKTATTTIVMDFSDPGDFNTLINSSDSLSLDKSVADRYRVRSSTALYDAIGKAFSLVPSDSDSVFVTIMTDGAENASRELNHADVQKLIKEKKEKNWTVTYMGTTEADIDRAVSFGINISNTVMFANSGKGVKKSLSKMSKMRSAFYTSNSDYASLSEEKQRSVKDSMETLALDTEEGDDE